ncbi:MAG: hypothetical protein NVSMB64_05750 [Candidatus Velthaea sp.]
MDRNLLVPLGSLVLAFVGALAAHRILFDLLTRLSKKKDRVWGAVVRRTRLPASYIMPLTALLVTSAALDDSYIPHKYNKPFEHLFGLATIAAVAWALIALVRLATDLAKSRYSIEAEDNLMARRVETRVDILSRATVSIVTIVAVAAALMTFPPIRALGTTLLASAGVAGLAIGIAARPVFENLIAGIQIALTQPIRIDDVVIVEKQYGRIETITSTYVVVRLWDQRRMVLPLTYFINTPFENWTVQSADLIGEVLIFTDYAFPVEALRAELPNILSATPLWNGKVQNVQVVEATERSIQIRALVSARNSSELWDLRAYAREKIIAFVRDRFPETLPRLRVENADVEARSGAVFPP